MNLQIILGNQLFPQKYYDKAPRLVFMCEDLNLCTHYRYHKHKIIFFLASMRKFKNQLEEKGFKVSYFQLQEKPQFFEQLKKICDQKKIKTISVYEVEDKFFEKQISDFCHMNKIKLKQLPSPMFLVSRDSFKFYNQKTKKPFMKTFYEELRRSSNILMEADGSPQGGKFSFDSENRKKIPKKYEVIQNKITSPQDPIICEVIELVDQYFAHHPGDSANFWMATNRQQALKVLHDFIKYKFENFGIYEDAIDGRDPFLYHSVLSPYLNIGFLTPQEVVDKALKAEVSLNSQEGFIRQIIGWREFVRGIYQEYSEQQDETNFFQHQNKLASYWYEGSTGLPPLDDAIKKVVRFGYNHHIERLMIISNVMLLCRVHPQQVYQWFMEMYVDSSDWVMGPNVYGMAQFSDGGIFATKPYISGSNYILKMSHYKKDDWCEIWDGLYWMFIHDNPKFFKTNYRMSMMVKMLDKMDQEKRKRIFSLAKKFIKKVTLPSK